MYVSYVKSYIFKKKTENLRLCVMLLCLIIKDVAFTFKT